MEYIQDSLFGRMFPEHSAVTEDEISMQSSMNSSTSSTIPPRFLRLVKTDGHPQTYMWAMDGALRTEYSTLNIGESPNVAEESTLSQILEERAPEKYYLSSKACLGILRRSERRGKQLPSLLKETLTQQIERLSDESLSDTLTASQDQYLFAVENHPSDSRCDIDDSGTVQTLTGHMGTGGNNVPMVMFSKSGRARSSDDATTWKESTVTNTLNTFDVGEVRTNEVIACSVACRNASEDEANSTNVCKQEYIVRRLTPLECCRLQGFPDDWCAGIPHSDSAEYKMWGNGIALPCALYVMQGIAEELEKESVCKTDSGSQQK